PYDTGATLLRLQAVISDYQPSIVISLGDSFHDGGGAQRMHASFRERLEALMAGRDWFWVAGNHDPEAPADLPGETVRELAIGSLLFRHEPSKQRVEGEIAGHLHPCARIVQQGRSVRRRCFAGDGGRMIMPAFGAYTGSLNVLDHAYAGLFRLDTLMAYMLGAQRIFAISGSMLRPG
ncbi:ligase-associated DNA damage response endonuclease PdeM, partial [Mesorhizobium sp. M7A.F.Ca.CA.004.05.1.1]